MTLSGDAKKILLRLEENGFEAYFVGGCVRDHILGRTIHDIDITTNALPEQIIGSFPDCKIVKTGIRHGTVTVICDGTNYEITTYRIDGDYSDSRRPDSVSFTRDLKEDLLRRDFTVNAIAMDNDGNIFDFYGGISDIKNKVIRCVGDPYMRFTEDALRILRALRFSSQLDFTIEENTSKALKELAGKLHYVSSERIRDELDKLICGKNAVSVMHEYRDVIAQIIPELRPCFDFDQRSHYHRYDVYTHIVEAVRSAPDDSLLLKRVMLFHDIGKPPMFTVDEKGEGHFKGHAAVSADIAGDVMTRLHYSSHEIAQTCELIAHHSDSIKSQNQVKKLISKMGEEMFFLLIEVKKADNMAKMEFVLEENDIFDGYAEDARRFIAENACMKLSQLAVNGNDIMSLGLEGKAVGAALKDLLSKVIGDELPNEKDMLLGYVKEKYNDKGTNPLN